MCPQVPYRTVRSKYGTVPNCTVFATVGTVCTVGTVGIVVVVEQNNSMAKIEVRGTGGIAARRYIDRESDRRIAARST